MDDALGGGHTCLAYRLVEAVRTLPEIVDREGGFEKAGLGFAAGDEVAGGEIRALYVVDEHGVTEEGLKIAVQQDERDLQGEEGPEVFRDHLGAEDQHAAAVGGEEGVEIAALKIGLIQIGDAELPPEVAAGVGDSIRQFREEGRVADDGAALFIYQEIN